MLTPEFTEHLPGSAVNEVAQLKITALFMVCASLIYQLSDVVMSLGSTEK